MSLGGKVAAGAAIALLVLSFPPWFRAGGSNDPNAWGGVLSLLGVLLGLALLIVMVLRELTPVGMPQRLGSLTWAQAYLIGAGAAFGLVLLQILVGHSRFGVKYGLTEWAALGLLAAGAMAQGALMNLQGERSRGRAEGAVPRA